MQKFAIILIIKVVILLENIISKSIEESAIKNLYKKYLEEIFNLDKINYKKLSYIIESKNSNSVFINPRSGEIVKCQKILNYTNGYAIIEKGIKKNFINEQGAILSEEWFDYVTDFHNGYALVRKNGLYNFIDTEGNFLLKKWEKINNTNSKFYPNGVGIISFSENNSKVIDKNGKIIFGSTFKIIFPFQGKYAVAIKEIRKTPSKNKYLFKGYEYHIIDCDGNDTKTNFSYIRQLSDNLFIVSEDNSTSKFIINSLGQRVGKENFDSVLEERLKNGHLIVSKYGKYNIMNENGKLLYDKWYSQISYPYKGICKIRDRGKYNYLNENKELISQVWFDDALDFKEDYTTVKIDGKYYVLDLNGKLSERGYDYIYKIYNGYGIAKNKDSFQVIDINGNSISDKWECLNKSTVYADKSLQDSMLIFVKNENGLYNYLNIDGTPLFKEWKENIIPISNGMIGIYENNCLEIYNEKGEQISSLDTKDLPELDVKSFRAIEDTKKIKRVKSTKKFFRYFYESNGKKYSLDYEPIVDYGDIIICENNDNYYVYQKVLSDTYHLGKKSEITLESTYITIGEKKYFISGTDFIDVTDLSFKRKIEKKDGVSRILTLDSFKEICQSPEYQEKIQQEIDFVKQSVIEEKNRQYIEESKRMQEKKIEELNNNKESLRKSLSNLSEILAECSKYIAEIQSQINNNNFEKVTVPEELLLVLVDDHLEINPIFLTNGIIKFINFSHISFNNVKISGIDLSYTNAHINPQVVYNKDMSNGKYCGLDFNLCSFENVNIENSDFKDAIIDFAQGTEEIRKGL